MAAALTVLFVLIRIISYPFIALLNAILYLLSPVWVLGKFILLPVIHLGYIIIRILTFPFRIQVLEQIETLYIYFGTAGLIGCMTGTILFILSKFLSSTLHIDAPKAREQHRTAAEYRAARRKRADAPGIETPVVIKRVLGTRKRGLLSQAIVEEEDSDF